MNWMRRNEQPRLRAMALARTVLPVPGTSSISRWPRHRSATRASRTSWCLPTITRSTLARTLSPVSWIFDIGLSRGGGRVRHTAVGSGVRGCDGPRLGLWCRGIVRRTRRLGSQPSGRCALAQPRNSVNPPTHAVIRQPTPPMTARNGSPPSPRASATPPNRIGEHGRDRGHADPLDQDGAPAASARPGRAGSGWRSRSSDRS